MDFGLSDEQRMLQKTAREFVARTCPAYRRRRSGTRPATYPTELFRGMAEQGWFSLPFPEAAGGADGSIVELCLLAEELGRASLDIAMCYAGTFIPGLTLLKWGSAAAARALPARDDGGHQPFCDRDERAGRRFRRGGAADIAVDAGDDFVVNGQKAWCTGRRAAGHRHRHVRADRPGRRPSTRGCRCCWSTRAPPGSRSGGRRRWPGTSWARTRSSCAMSRVPKATWSDPLNGGWQVMLSGLDVEKVLMSAAYVGMAQATLDEALDVLQGTARRSAVPSATFQAISHALADLQTEIDSARLLSYRAAWLLANGQRCTREGAMAKLKGSETYVEAARWGMQILAGHGFSTESVMSFRWRESIVATISGGTSQIQRNAIARSMGLRSY